LRGFGKSTERNPALIPCAPKLFVVQFGCGHCILLTSKAWSYVLYQSLGFS